MRRLPVPPRWEHAIAIVDGLTSEDIERGMFFTPDEIATVPEFAIPQRRNEWFAARLAAKLLAVDRGWCASPNECRVERIDRAPKLVRRDGTAYDVSLSLAHSRGTGAAALLPKSVGVDLEGVRTIHDRVERYFLHPEEIEMRKRLVLPDAALHLWSAKEAALKAAGCALLKDLTLSVSGMHYEGVAGTFRWGSVEGEVETERYGDFVLALAAVV